MKRNQKCFVSHDSPYHQGKDGYFQFYGEGESEGTVVLSETPDNVNRLQGSARWCIVLFAVDKRFVKVVG